MVNKDRVIDELEQLASDWKLFTWHTDKEQSSILKDIKEICAPKTPEEKWRILIEWGIVPAGRPGETEIERNWACEKCINPHHQSNDPCYVDMIYEVVMKGTKNEE